MRYRYMVAAALIILANPIAAEENRHYYSSGAECTATAPDASFTFKAYGTDYIHITCKCLKRDPDEGKVCTATGYARPYGRKATELSPNGGGVPSGDI